MKNLLALLLCCLTFSLTSTAQHTPLTGSWPNYQIGNSTFTISCDGFVIVDLDHEVTRYKVFNSNDLLDGPEIVDLWVGNGTLLPQFFDEFNSSDFGMDLIMPEDNFFIEVYIGENPSSTVLPVSSLIEANCPIDGLCGGTEIEIDCAAVPGDDPTGVTVTFGPNPTRLKVWNFNNTDPDPTLIVELPNANVPVIPAQFNTAVNGIIIPCDGNIFVEVVYNNFQCTETFNISDLIDEKECCVEPACGGTDIAIDCAAVSGDNPAGVTVTFGPNPTRLKVWNFNNAPTQQLLVEIPNGNVSTIPAVFNTAANGITIPCDGNVFIEVVYNDFQCTETFNISDLIEEEECCEEVPCGGTDIAIDCAAVPGDDPAGVTVTFGPNPTRLKVWDFNNTSGPTLLVEIPNGNVPAIPPVFNTAANGIVIPCDGNVFIEVVYNDFQCTETFNISNLIDLEGCCEEEPCGGTDIAIDCTAVPGDDPTGVTVTFGPNPTRLKVWDFNNTSGPSLLVEIPNSNVPVIPPVFNTATNGIVIPCKGNVFIEVVYNDFQCTETFNISNLIDLEGCCEEEPCGGTDIAIDCTAVPGDDPTGVTVTFGPNPTRLKVWDFNNTSGPSLLVEIPNSNVPVIPPVFNTATNGIVIPCKGNVFIEVVYNDFQCTETFNISDLIDLEGCCDDAPCGGTELEVDCNAYPGTDNPAGITITFGPNPNRFKVWDFENNPGSPITDLPNANVPVIPAVFNTAANGIILPANGNILIEVSYDNYECTEEFNITKLLADECGGVYESRGGSEGGEGGKGGEGGDGRSDSANASVLSLEKMSLYPNPTTGKVNIDLPQIEKAYQIEVFDLNGKLMQSNLLFNNNALLDFEGFENGIYILKASGGEYNFVEKVQILR